MNNDLEQFLLDCRSLFRPAVVGASLDAFRDNSPEYQSLKSEGFFVARLDPHPIDTLDQLMTNFAVQCGFPSYFGGNWDALKDCLCDFSWLLEKPAGISLWYHAPLLVGWKNISMLLVVLEAVRSIWSYHNIPFKLVLLDTTATSQE